MQSRSLILTVMFIVGLMGTLASSQAQTKGTMKYLVIGEFIDPGPMMAPPQLAQMMEQAILPSLEMLSKWEADKKISGGIYVGERKGVFIIDAESNEEVDSMLRGLPFWGLLKWEVSPLQSYAGRAAQDKLSLQKMKSMMK